MQYMSLTLLPASTMRLADIEVYEWPNFLPETPIANNPSIYSVKHTLRIPLNLDGIISYLT